MKRGSFCHRQKRNLIRKLSKKGGAVLAIKHIENLPHFFVFVMFDGYVTEISSMLVSCFMRFIRYGRSGSFFTS